MAGRTLAELEELRARNRAALGMAGYSGMGAAATVPGLPGPAPSAIGPYIGQIVNAIPGGITPGVRVGSAFPPVDYTWDPSNPSQPATGEGSPLAEWFTRHVVRPFVEVGPVRYAPGDGYADYSGLAAVLLGIAGALGLTVAWLVARWIFTPRGGVA